VRETSAKEAVWGTRETFQETQKGESERKWRRIAKKEAYDGSQTVAEFCFLEKGAEKLKKGRRGGMEGKKGHQEKQSQRTSATEFPNDSKGDHLKRGNYKAQKGREGTASGEWSGDWGESLSPSVQRRVPAGKKGGRW